MTIFVSTHFMNEAARCDRISLMHAGRVLATDTPAALVGGARRGQLEDAFVGYLEEAAGEAAPAAVRCRASRPDVAAGAGAGCRAFSPRRLLAYRPPRKRWSCCATACGSASPCSARMLLMLVFGFGITIDVENLTFAALDRDRTPESRAYLEELRGSRYFVEHPPIADGAELERRLRSGELRLAIEIPPGFGRDVIRGRPTEVAAWIDGAMPFRAETIRGYLQGVHQGFLADAGAAAERAAGGARRHARDAVPLQPGLREPLRHGAGHHRRSCWCSSRRS